MLNTKDTYDDSRTQVKNSVGFIGKIAVTLPGLLVKTFTTLVDRWKTGCRRQPQSAERMEELVDSVWSVVRQGNECEDQWEGVQDSGKTGTDVRGRDMGIEDGTGT